MKVKDIIKSSSESFSVEVLPPVRGKSCDELLDQLCSLQDPKFVSITSHRNDVKFLPEGVLFKRVEECKRPGTVALAARIKFGLDKVVVPHIVCTGNTTQMVDNEIIDLNMLGIENVLLLRGDGTLEENGPQSSFELIKQVVSSSNGISFGVACYPEKHIEAMSRIQDQEVLQKKHDLGASFAISQMCFSSKALISYIKSQRKKGIEIIPGIKVLTKVSQLRVIPKIFNCTFPDNLYMKLSVCSTDEEVRKVGILHAIEMVNDLYKAGIPIVHFYTTNSMIPVVDVMNSVLGR